MMSCNNCFNGCVEITSDKCVKYTGSTIPSLGITNGDSLAEVELAITNFLTTVLDGTGIIPSLEDGILCTIISDYLPEGDLTLPALLSAIIQATCAIQDQVSAIDDDISNLNSEYTTSCITVDDNTNTHEVVQAVITALCALDGVIQQLLADLPLTYVALSDLNNLIDAHLTGTSTLYSARMVPYTAVEFWGDPAGKFDGSGAGIGDWANIYLCNGNNGTPDKRGRVTVCATNNMGGGAYQAAVDPATGNPSYSLYSIGGENNVALTSANQLPSHTHVATPVVTLADHTHYMVGVAGNEVALTAAYPIKYDNAGSGADYTLKGTDSAATVGKTSASKSTVTATTDISYVGASATHNNVQPVIACYYIMYIPA